MPSKPDRFYIDQSDVQNLEIIKSEIEVFKRKSKRELFLIAMSYGVRNETRIPLAERNKKEWDRLEYLREEDEYLIDAVALFAEGSEVLLDSGLKYQIAEEYAHGGISILYGLIQKPGFFEKNFEKDLVEAYNEFYGTSHV